MTLKTWKQKFYPITAKQAARGGVVKAVQHSLLKWEGLRDKNLKKHGIEYVYAYFDSRITDGKSAMDIDARSCSLCEKFADAPNYCRKCPIYESRGEVRCDMPKKGEDASPYEEMLRKGNPLPMIKTLRKALKYTQENS